MKTQVLNFESIDCPVIRGDGSTISIFERAAGANRCNVFSRPLRAL